VDTTRLIVTLHVVADVDLDEVAASDGLDPAKDNVLGHYAAQLAGFLENEVNNCPDMPGAVTVRAETDCNALFCILNAHEGDQHVNATGHTWSEATPSASAIAHVYLRAGETEAQR
jgi:hypothetical protein